MTTAIARRVVESYPPRYRPSEQGRALPPLLRAPLGAQAEAIRGAALSLEAQRLAERQVAPDGVAADPHLPGRRPPAQTFDQMSLSQKGGLR